MLQIDLFNFHSKGSVICKLTLIFAATPSNKNAELLADLQKEVSAGKVGYFTVDRSRPVNVEPDEGKINIESRGKKKILRNWKRGLRKQYKYVALKEVEVHFVSYGSRFPSSVYRLRAKSELTGCLNFLGDLRK